MKFAKDKDTYFYDILDYNEYLELSYEEMVV